MFFVLFSNFLSSPNGDFPYCIVPFEALQSFPTANRINSLSSGLPRRTSNTRRSNSRGEQILSNAVNVKPLGRRSASAGIRKIRRWLNDHLVFARTLYTYEYDPQNHEQEFLERLEHMLIKIPQYSSPLMRLTEEGGEILRYFRHGGTVLPTSSLLSSTTSETVTSGSSSASSSREAELTVQSLLSKMYRRINISIRPNLLREARRASQLLISSSNIAYRPLITEAEILMLRLLDKSIITALEITDQTSTATTVPLDSSVELWKTLLDLGEEFHGALASPIRLCVIDIKTTNVSVASASSTAEEKVQIKGIELPLIDGYARMLIRGIASFYGIRVDSYIESSSSLSKETKNNKNVVKVLQLYVPPSVTKAAKIERAAVAMVRQQLAEVWKADLEVLRSNSSENSQLSNDQEKNTHESIHAPSSTTVSSSSAPPPSVSTSSSSSSPSDTSTLPSDHPFAQLEPLVPLYALHVRTIDNNQRNLSKKNLFKPKFSYGKQYLRRDDEEEEGEEEHINTHDDASLRTMESLSKVKLGSVKGTSGKK